MSHRVQSWFTVVRGHGLVEGLDFVGPRQKPSLFSWALLALAVAATVFVADEVARVEQDHRHAQDQQRRLLMAERRLRMETAKVAAQHSAPSEAPPLKEDELLPAAYLASALAFPWAQVLSVTEEAAQQEGAVLMAFDLALPTTHARSAAGIEVKLQAAVHDDAAALRWAARHPNGRLHSREKLSSPFSTVRGTYLLQAEASARFAVGGER